MAEPGERKPQSWAAVQTLLSVASVLVALGSLLQMVNSLEQRMTDMEMRERSNATVMAEMNGNIKVLLERTDPRQP